MPASAPFCGSSVVRQKRHSQNQVCAGPSAGATAPLVGSHCVGTRVWHRPVEQNREDEASAPRGACRCQGETFWPRRSRSGQVRASLALRGHGRAAEAVVAPAHHRAMGTDSHRARALTKAPTLCSVRANLPRGARFSRSTRRGGLRVASSPGCIIVSTGDCRPLPEPPL